MNWARPTEGKVALYGVLLSAGLIMIAAQFDRVTQVLLVLGGLTVIWIHVGRMEERRQRQDLAQNWYLPRRFSFEVRRELQPHWLDIYKSQIECVRDLQDVHLLGVLACLLEVSGVEREQLLTRVREHDHVPAPWSPYQRLRWREVVHHTSLVRQVWAEHERKFGETGTVVDLWPPLIDEEELHRGVQDLATASEHFAELVDVQAVRKDLAEWVCGPKGLRTLHMHTGGVLLTDGRQVQVGSEFPGIVPFLVYLEENGFSSGHLILEFPQALAIELQRHGVVYFDEFRHHGVDDSVPHRREYGLSGQPEVNQEYHPQSSKARALLRRAGISLSDTFVDEHWFSASFGSMGLSLEVFR